MTQLIEARMSLFPQRLMGAVVPLVGDGVREGLGSRSRAQVPGSRGKRNRAGSFGNRRSREQSLSPLLSPPLLSPLVSALPLLLSAPPHPGL